MSDPRWPDEPRDRDHDRELNQGSRGGLSNSRDRASLDPRDVFMKDLDLPRGPNRWPVRARGGDVTLRGSESRTVSIVGAFRIVPAGDLRDGQECPLDPRTSDLLHLKEAGLVQITPAAGNDCALVILTDKGRETFSNVIIDRRFLRDSRETLLQREANSTTGGRSGTVRGPMLARHHRSSTRASVSLAS